MTLDRVPGPDNLYIGGIFTLRKGRAIEDDGITHVVTALSQRIDHEMFEKCKKHIEFLLDDDEQEDILQYFSKSNKFIEDALEDGGKVFVHCAMGKSRSATLVVAYLMKSRGLGVEEALALLREGRPFAEPNNGFMDQLRLFEKMGCPANVDEQPIYQRWLFQRELARSREIYQAPDKIRFEDEVNSPPAEAKVEEDRLSEAREYRCRKCRRNLATSTYVVHTSPKESNDTCSHVFIEPLSWMRPELELGKLDGKLECPNEKCRQSVGKYAWIGNKCSCNAWITPAISLHRSKIDDFKLRKAAVPGKI